MNSMHPQFDAPTRKVNFEMTELPFEAVNGDPVLAFPIYSAPRYFVRLEAKFDSDKPTLVAHCTEAGKLDQVNSIPLEVADETIEAMNHARLMPGAYPMHVEDHILGFGDHLMAYNTLWSINLRDGKSALDSGEDSLKEYYANLRADRYVTLVGCESEQDANHDHPWIYSSDLSKKASAISYGQVMVMDREETELIYSVAEPCKAQYTQLRFGWKDQVIVFVKDQSVEVHHLNQRGFMFHTSGSAFAINDEGLLVVVDGCWLRGFDLNRMLHVFDLPTTSTSKYVHVSLDNFREIHVVHGSKWFQLQVPLAKLKGKKCFESKTHGYGFGTVDSPCKLMTFPDVLRHFESHHKLSLRHLGFQLFLQAGSSVMQLPYGRSSAVKVMKSESGESLPLLKGVRNEFGGSLWPMKGGALYFSEWGSTKRTPVISPTVLSQLRISEFASMKRRIEAHQDEICYDMYLRIYKYDKKISYQHHAVACSANGQHVVTATSWNAIRVWDVNSGRLVAQFEIPESKEMLGESVARVVCSDTDRSLTVFMHDGTVYQLLDYLKPTEKLEQVIKINGFNRIDVAWVQSNRYALITEGFVGPYATEITHSSTQVPVIFDLMTLEFHAMPPIQANSCYEEPLAICPSGRYLLMQTAMEVNGGFAPGVHRVIDLQDQHRVVSELKISSLTRSVSEADENGRFYMLNQSYDLLTYQWITAHNC